MAGEMADSMAASLVLSMAVYLADMWGFGLEFLLVLMWEKLKAGEMAVLMVGK